MDVWGRCGDEHKIACVLVVQFSTVKISWASCLVSYTGSKQWAILSMYSEL